MRLYVLILYAACTGCGADSDGESENAAPTTPYSMALDSAAELPPCDDAHDKQLVYVLATKEFQTCQAGAWVKVEMAAPTASTPADPAEVNRVKNAIATIKVGDTLETMLPDARAVVLSGTKVGSGDATTGDDTYTISKYDGATGGTKLYYYTVTIERSNGQVSHIYEG
jgi:hypothetical protein